MLKNINCESYRTRYQEIIDMQEFYFQKLKDMFDEFEAYNIDDQEIEFLIKEAANKGKFSFEEYVEKNKKYENFLLLIGKMISVFDFNGFNKNEWNPYDDKRVVAKAGVRQNAWIMSLLKYKLGQDGDGSVQNAIDLIKNPRKNLAMLSENHRKKVSERLLKKEYKKEQFFDDVKRYFLDMLKDIKIQNQDNFGFLLSVLLYCDTFRNIWNDDQNAGNPMNNTEKYPLNQILFGSPGTGKTYNTINKALLIIDGEVPKNRKEAKKRFDELRNSGQIEFVTFHQSYGYEEFVEGIKADVDSEEVRYKLENGVFKKLSKKAEKNLEISSNKTSIKKEFDQVFKEKVLDKLIENDTLEIKMKKNSFYIKEVDDRRISFDKSGGDSKHVLLIRNLKAMYEQGENTLIAGGLSHYYDPLLDYLLEDSIYENTTTEEAKNFVLIIDEINRGNISKIFGELITLIEESKRIGKDEEIRVRLPYSNELFGVPQNLYIIGTMNTADRSIAPIDTALRRRFEFVEMSPKPSLISSDCEGVNLQMMLEAINSRIEYLYDKDHTIGHAYLIDVKNLDDLRFVFRNKIIPLLAEYFYEDWENIALVLNDNGFVKEHKEEQKYLANIKHKINNKKIYRISDHSWTDKDFMKIYEQSNS